MHNYKNLKIWQEAMTVCKAIYTETQSFPDTEKFGLANQLRRASVSIASNIAEGSSRSSDKDFARYLEMAQGSSFEMETQVLIAGELNYINPENTFRLSEKITQLQRMIFSFKNTIIIKNK